MTAATSASRKRAPGPRQEQEIVTRLLVLNDHINTCVRTAIESGDADEKVDELVAGVRRYIKTR